MQRLGRLASIADYPEQRLAVAVLVSAVRDLGRRDREAVADAAAFFATGAFEPWALLAGLEPGALVAAVGGEGGGRGRCYRPALGRLQTRRAVAERA